LPLCIKYEPAFSICSLYFFAINLTTFHLQTSFDLTGQKRLTF